MKLWFRRRQLLGLRTLILIIIAVSLLIFEQRDPALSKIRSSLSLAVVPVQYLVDGPVHLVYWVTSRFQTRTDLLAENQSLRAEQLTLHLQLQQLLAAQQDNIQLQELLKSSTRFTQKVLVAQLLAIDSEAGSEQVIVNQGTRSDVYVGQPVLDAEGILGQVIETGLLTSRILLITDPHSAIPVEDVRTNYRAIAVGNGDAGTLRLVNVPTTASFQVGDQLVSSGLGGRFPAGYPVGVITEVQKDASQSFANITVQPSGHLNQSRLVLLIWPNLPEQPLTFGPLPTAEASITTPAAASGVMP